MGVWRWRGKAYRCTVRNVEVANGEDEAGHGVGDGGFEVGWEARNVVTLSEVLMRREGVDDDAVRIYPALWEAAQAHLEFPQAPSSNWSRKHSITIMNSYCGYRKTPEFMRKPHARMTPK